MGQYIRKRQMTKCWNSCHAQMLWLVLGFGLGGGCGKSGVAGELAAFKDSGHTISEFSDLDANGLGAKKCQTGIIDQLSALLCEYGSSENVQQGTSAAEKWAEGASTSIVLRRGPILLALADRSNADPQGKTLTALSKVFRHAKGR